eukprot:TRINITY_DN74756_c0_g1_i1.p1 TRINITY_DN74756_c0_g1~~TRINITY_DN74756_c0_g1_i1.p1  ORF type:complete len:739 (-),score=151.49 TRINITY_DN74756_c0_g1_i1:208-2424(-)
MTGPYHTAPSPFFSRRTTSLPAISISQAAGGLKVTKACSSTKSLDKRGAQGADGNWKVDHMPVWPSHQQVLQRLCGLVAEIASLWHRTNSTEEEKLADADAICVVAEARVAALRRKCAELELLCDALRDECWKGVETLRGEFSQDVADAANLPLNKRKAGLEAVLERIRQRLARMRAVKDELSACLAALGLDAEALAALGLSGIGTVAELEETLAKMKEFLLERRAIALKTLERTAKEIPCSDVVAYLTALRQQVHELQAEVADLRERALKAARRGRVIREELGGAPELPADGYAVLLAEERGANETVTASMAASVFASLESWEAKRSAAKAEAEKLHRQLAGFLPGSAHVAFLKNYGGLHKDHRGKCREKLEELKAALRAEEAPARDRLRHLYIASGLELVDLDVFFEELEDQDTRDDRRSCLGQEIKRMEAYLESISPILSKMEELKALVTAAASFEAAIRAGYSRFSGNAVHFLEEEKFRRRFVIQLPTLRDRLIDVIDEWQGTENKQFRYRGEDFQARLVQMKDMGADLIRVPGDLSVVEVLSQLLDVKIVAAKKRESALKNKGGRELPAPLEPISAPAAPVTPSYAGPITRSKSVPAGHDRRKDGSLSSASTPMNAHALPRSFSTDFTPVKPKKKKEKHQKRSLPDLTTPTAGSDASSMSPPSGRPRSLSELREFERNRAGAPSPIRSGKARSSAAAPSPKKPVGVAPPQLAPPMPPRGPPGAGSALAGSLRI